MVRSTAITRRRIVRGQSSTSSGTHVQTPDPEHVPETPTSTHASTSHPPLSDQQDTDVTEDDDSVHVNPIGDTRPLLELLMGNDDFRPREVVTKIGEIVFKKLEVGAYQWKRITPGLKEQMFEEFKNHFRWDLSDEDLTLEVKRRFMKKGPILYKGRIYKLKQLYLEEKPKPANITDDVWNALVSHWKNEEATEASRQAKKNRTSEVEPGAGISKTFGGSCSFAEMAARLVDENEGEELSLDELYMHTRTKDGQWVDLRSKKIYDEYERRLELLGPNPTKQDKTTLFLACNPVDKKHRAFGLGSVASSLGSTGSSQQRSITSGMFTQEDVNGAVQAGEQRLQQQLEEQKKVMEEQMKAMEEQRKATESLATKLELFMGSR